MQNKTNGFSKIDKLTSSKAEGSDIMKKFKDY